MKPPLPVPRFVPAERDWATRNDRSSLVGSLSRIVELARTTRRSSALPGPRACMVNASTRTLSGASFS